MDPHDRDSSGMTTTRTMEDKGDDGYWNYKSHKRLVEKKKCELNSSFVDLLVFVIVLFRDHA